jgi:predicted adenine nucleotide alpha hydrolase (AANH) superfamily ATPase
MNTLLATASLVTQSRIAYDLLDENQKDFANANLKPFGEYLSYLTNHWARQHMTGAEMLDECYETYIDWYNAIRLGRFGLGSDGYNE